MPRKGNKAKSYLELNEELSQLLNEEKEVTEKEVTVKTNLENTDKLIDSLKKDIIDLRTRRTVTIAELDGQLKHKKNELLKTQKLRRSIVYEHGKIHEKHKSIQRNIARRQIAVEERKSKFMEKMKGNEKPIAPPSGLEGIGVLEIKDNNGDGN